MAQTISFLAKRQEQSTTQASPPPVVSSGTVSPSASGTTLLVSSVGSQFMSTVESSQASSPQSSAAITDSVTAISPAPSETSPSLISAAPTFMSSQIASSPQETSPAPSASAAPTSPTSITEVTSPPPTSMSSPTSDGSNAVTSQPTSDSPTSQPTSEPPTSQPTSDPPTSQPTSQPPTSQPTSDPPTSQPTSDPPTSQPTSQPPTSQPTSQPPTSEPTSQPPTTEPTSQPPTAGPTSNPPTSEPPSSAPTSQPPTTDGGSSSSTSPEEANINTSSLPPATTTFRSIISITLTSSGEVLTTAPPVVTQTVTTTGADGRPSIVTIIGNNPTPISDGGRSGSASEFFRNKGAVAGVFLVVGLAAASIIIFLFFFIRKRRRMRRLEYDTAVASTLAAAGYNRGPVDGDDDGPAMRQVRGGDRSPFSAGTVASMHSGGGSGSAGTRPPSGYMDDPSAGPTPLTGEFDPYAAYGTVHLPPTAVVSGRKDGYMPARTSSPPPGVGHSRQPSLSSSSGLGGHMARESAGSFEPLLSQYRQGSSPPGTPGAAAAATLFAVPVPDVPPRNPARDNNSRSAEGSAEAGGHASGGERVRDSASSVYSEADDQLIDLTPTTKLEVRNLPDGQRAGADISREPSRRQQ